MSRVKPVSAVHVSSPLLVKLREIHSNKKNCTMTDRADFWLHHGGKSLELNPNAFHTSIANWLLNAGLIDKDRTDDIIAALYCLGVANSNNLFQKVSQGKMETCGIGNNGRRNSKAKSGR